MDTIKTSTLLKNKSLKLLIIARILTNFAYQMITVAIGWDIYSLTHSAFYLGLVGLIQFLPTFFLSLFVGQLSDSHDRRKIIRISQTSQCIFILALAFTSFNGLITKERFLVLILFIAMAHSFEGPPLQALLPNIVDREVFPNASALMSSASQFAVIVGPGAGGIIYSFSSTLVYTLAGFTLFLSSLLISQISVKKEERILEPKSLKTLLVL